MAIFKITETHEIIKAFTTTYYEIEAESEEEAIQMIDDQEVDNISYEVDVRDTEFMYRVVGK